MALKFKTAVFSVIFLCCYSGLHAQFYAGLVTGNYSGIVGATDNPASIAGNYYDLDIAILGVNAFGETNFAKITRESAFMNFNFGSATSSLIRNDKVKFGTIKAEVLLPSAMIRYKKGWSFGLINRFRAYINLAQLSPDFANLWADGFENSDYFGTTYSDENMFWYGQYWLEIGAVAAKEIKIKSGRLKFGGTIKYLRGYGAMHAQMYDMDVTPNAQKEVIMTNVNGRIGYSDNLEQGFSMTTASQGLNFGLDLGAVYEHDPKLVSNPGHPHAKDKYYEEKWGIRYYMYRLGLAVKDIGGIKYNMGSSGLKVTGIRDPFVPINLDDIRNSVNDPQDIAAALDPYFFTEPETGSYKMGLPTSIEANFDYNLNNGRYINVHTTYSLRKKNSNKNPVQEFNNIVVTPRWENAKYGVYMPIYHHFGRTTNVGLAGRAGALTLGIHNIIPFLFTKDMSSAGFYFVIKTNFLPKSQLRCAAPKWKRGKTKKKNIPDLKENHSTDVEKRTKWRKKNFKKG